MWLFGTSLIVGYYFVPQVHDLLENLGKFKARYGWKFSVVSTGIFGGLIPTVIPFLMGHKNASSTVGFICFSTLLWAYKGIEIDLFYHFQNWVFGSGLDLQTIATKTFCDQLIMVPLFGMPNVIMFYQWRSCGYSFSKLWKTLTRDWYGKMVLPVLIANWVIWIPAVAMIYSLPIALQLPVQNMILCFWVLILVFFTENSE